MRILWEGSFEKEDKNLQKQSFSIHESQCCPAAARSVKVMRFLLACARKHFRFEGIRGEYVTYGFPRKKNTL